jgi:hypothetical protein
MYKEDATAIHLVIETYFTGIFYGDTDKLRSAFHPQAVLFGDINEKFYFKSLNEYLDGVANRKNPNALGEEFRMKVLAIEITGNIAIAKLNVPMFEFNYYDYLHLVKNEGQWAIAGKLFTNVTR